MGEGGGVRHTTQSDNTHIPRTDLWLFDLAHNKVKISDLFNKSVKRLIKQAQLRV